MSTDIEELMSRMEVTRKGAERIAAIIQAGISILLEEGFTGLTKRRIAARLGISHGNVSYYFPTRESLWRAVIDSELKLYYARHYGDMDSSMDDPRQRLDQFIQGWIDEYRDRETRIFFSQMIAFAEVNEVIAGLRDEIYESFYVATLDRVRAVVPDTADDVLRPRVLGIIALLEGLHAVTAFRPGLLNDGEDFRKQLLRQAHALAQGVGGPAD